MSRVVKKKGVLGGKPVIEGTRISVDLLVSYFSNDLTLDDIYRDYPNLKGEEIKVALEYAEKRIERAKGMLEPSTS